MLCAPVLNSHVAVLLTTHFAPCPAGPWGLQSFAELAPSVVAPLIMNSLSAAAITSPTSVPEASPDPSAAAPSQHPGAAAGAGAAAVRHTASGSAGPAEQLESSYLAPAAGGKPFSPFARHKPQQEDAHADAAPPEPVLEAAAPTAGSAAAALLHGHSAGSVRLRPALGGDAADHVRMRDWMFVSLEVVAGLTMPVSAMKAAVVATVARRRLVLRDAATVVFVAGESKHRCEGRSWQGVCGRGGR